MDNVASKERIIKETKNSLLGKALRYLQYSLMLNNPVRINTDQVSTTNMSLLIAFHNTLNMMINCLIFSLLQQIYAHQH